MAAARAAMRAHDEIGTKSGGHRALGQGSKIVLPLGVIAAAILGVIIYFRDDALQKINDSSTASAVNTKDQQELRGRVIRLESNDENMRRSLEELKQLGRETNVKLDQALSRSGFRP